MSIATLIKSLATLVTDQPVIYVTSDNDLRDLLKQTTIAVMEKLMNDANDDPNSLIEMDANQRQDVSDIVDYIMPELAQDHLLDLSKVEFKEPSRPKTTWNPERFPLFSMAPTRTKDLKIIKKHDGAVVVSVSGRFNAKHAEIWKEMAKDVTGKYHELFGRIQNIDKSPLCAVNSAKQVTFFASKRWKNTPERIEQILVDVLGIE